MSRLRKILKLASPKYNGIMAAKSNNLRGFFKYAPLGTIESIVRGVIIGGGIAYLATNGEHVLEGAIFVGGIDLFQHHLKGLKLTWKK